MNISELIKDLEEVKEEHGDLDVRVWADHGQWCMKAFAVGPQWVDENGDTVCQEDIDDGEYEADDFIRVVEIAG